MMGTVRRVCRNVKRWQNADMALRWTAAGMMEAAKGFRRLKAYKQLSILKAALAAHHVKNATKPKLEEDRQASSRQVQQSTGHPLRYIHVRVAPCCEPPPLS